MLKISSVKDPESTSLQTTEKLILAEPSFRVVAQPSLSAFGYEEVYIFEVTREISSADLRKKIIAFYSMLGVNNLQFDFNTISFERGTLQGSLLRGTEADHRQKVEIIIYSYENGYSINCHFKCFTPFINLHISPSELENECRLLQKYLNTDLPFEPTRCPLSKQTDQFLNLLISSTFISLLLLTASFWNSELSLLATTASVLTGYFWVRFLKFRHTHLR